MSIKLKHECDQHVWSSNTVPCPACEAGWPDPHAELERQLLQPAPEMTHFTGLTNRYGDSIAKAVDDYLLMERKARAWDELRAIVCRFEQSCPVTVAQLDALVHPAQPSAPAER